MSRVRHPQRANRAERGHPATCGTITGAKDLPEIVFTPSHAVDGDRSRRRRRRFTPAEPTTMPAANPTDDHTM